jgi:hypothetical protein
MSKFALLVETCVLEPRVKSAAWAKPAIKVIRARQGERRVDFVMIKNVI